MKELKCLFLIFCCFLVGIFGYHFPEQDMDVPQIIDYYGYTCETIYAETEDGYYLTLHRIPFGKNDTEKDASKPRPVVFLQHGLLGSSADWTTNIPSQSAAYVFADSGFDVWIGNVRGNVYSLKHRKYSHFQPAFWNFSFDDMAKIDIPTMVQKALSVSGQKSLYFVGHSQGTAVMFAQGSEDQEFAKNISAFFALAPVSTVAHIRGLMSYIGSHFISHMGRLIQLFGAYEFLPENIFSKFFAFLICGMGFTNPLCNNILFQIGGPDSKDINMTRVMIYMDHTPAGTSTKNIVHWGQMTQSGKFCKYDYGSQNMKFYGQKTPPEYDISQLKIPTYLYYSVDDWLADPLDVEGYIMAKLPNSTLKEANHLGIYNHMDYIWGMHAAEKIYHPIIDRIRKMESIKSNRVF